MFSIAPAREGGAHFTLWKYYLKVKEAEILERIESDRAKQRLITSTGGNNPRPVEILPQAEGKTRDIVAEKIGMSGRIACLKQS